MSGEPHCPWGMTEEIGKGCMHRRTSVGLSWNLWVTLELVERQFGGLG